MEEEKPQNHAHIDWSFPEYISALPAKCLADADLAMDYFALSPFWDPQCNNNQLRTQNRIVDPTYGSAKEKAQLLKYTTGFEYVVAHAHPPELFVIHRRPVLEKYGRGKATHAYWILHDKIYMSPSLYDVMATRLRNAALLVEDTFDSLEKQHPPANPRASSVWRAAGDAPKAKKVEESADEEKEKEREAEREKEKEAQSSNYFLTRALFCTNNAMPGLKTLAASGRPEHDVTTEQKELEAMAQAAVRPFSSRAAPRAQGSAPLPVPPIITTPALGLGTPMAAAAGTPQGLNGTPIAGLTELTPGALSAVTQRPRLASLGRAPSNFAPSNFAPSNFAPSLPADSPAP